MQDAWTEILSKIRIFSDYGCQRVLANVLPKLTSTIWLVRYHWHARIVRNVWIRQGHEAFIHEIHGGNEAIEELCGSW